MSLHFLPSLPPHSCLLIAAIEESVLPAPNARVMLLACCITLSFGANAIFPFKNNTGGMCLLFGRDWGYPLNLEILVKTPIRLE